MLKLATAIGEADGLYCGIEGVYVGSCPLIEKFGESYRLRSPGEIFALIATVYGQAVDGTHIMRGLEVAATALQKRELALAMIAVVQLRLGEFDDRNLIRLAATEQLLKANFNPNEPRVPEGDQGGGRWTYGSADAPPASNSRPFGPGPANSPKVPSETAVADRDRKSICIERCAHILERPLPYRWSNRNTFAFHRCVNECMAEAE